MSNVIQLIQPISLDKIMTELNAITGPETTGIALIVSTPETIAVRTWGDTEAVKADVKEAAKELN